MVKEIISSLENQLLVTSSIDPKTSFLVEINGNRSTNRMDELVRSKTHQDN